MDWDAELKEIAEANRKAWDEMDHAKLKTKSDAEFERWVELGWCDKDGSPVMGEASDPDEDDEDEEDEVDNG